MSLLRNLLGRSLPPDDEDDLSAEEGDVGSSGEEEEHFDISLAATHSYMGNGLVCVSGRSVLEAGWTGELPVLAHAGAVFPGEIVPMLLPHANDAQALTQAIQKYDKLFGLLCPDESGTLVSGYGVVCEIFEAALGADEEPATLTLKARAIHRFRMLDPPPAPHPMHDYARARLVRVRVLPELAPRDPLRDVRLCSLDPHRRRLDQPYHLHSMDRRLRGMDAVSTPWPLFVYQVFDYPRLRQIIVDYFKQLKLEKLPEEPVTLSFWVASNLALTPRDRLALFALDNALLRLSMEVRFMTRTSVLCCSSCMTEIARREHIFAMSTEGVHAHYTNVGGHTHDVVTVTRCRNTALSGPPSDEYSWFPGYQWTVALCAACRAHVGWLFKATKKSLRPQQFYGVCRNYVQPRTDDPSTPPLRPPDLEHLRHTTMADYDL